MKVTNILLADYASGGNDSPQKLSLNGVFHALLVPSLPFTLKNFHLVWMTELSKGDLPPAYHVSITDPKGKALLQLRGTPDEPQPEEKELVVAVANIGVGGVEFSEPGLHRVVVKAASDNVQDEHEIGLHVMVSETAK